MSRVTWGAPSERYFETGVDRGVLYPNSDTAIAWTGLTAVNETTRGGEPRPTYIDGIKIRNLASKEEYEATIEAFTAPREFDLCDGRMEIQKGLIATNQRRKAFGFSYRTRIGNALDGPEHGYKIHLVYNAMAGPSERNHATIGDSTEAETLSWPITTRAPFTSGIRPTAHFVIDTRYTPKGLLAAVENMLYGNDVSEGRLPLISELIAMFKSEGPLTRTNYNPNPAYRNPSGSMVEVRRNMANNPAYKWNAPTLSEVRRNLELNPIPDNVSVTTGWSPSRGTLSVESGYLRLTITDATAGNFSQRINHAPSDYYAVTPNDYMSISYDSRNNTGSRMGALVVFLQADKTTIVGSSIAGGYVNVNDTTFTRSSFTVTVPATAAYMTVYLGGENAGAVNAVGKWLDFRHVLIEKMAAILPYFDGNSPIDNNLGLTASWTGAPGVSPSILSGKATYTTCFQGYLRPNWKPAPGRAEDGTDTSICYVTSNLNQTLLFFSRDAPAIAEGEYASARFRARLVNPTTTALTINAQIYAYTSTSSALRSMVLKAVTLPLDGSWVDVVLDGPSAFPANSGQIRLYVTVNGSVSARTELVEISNVLVEKQVVARSWFDGNKAPSEGVTYVWDGAVDLAQSVGTAVRSSGWNSAIYKTAYGRSWMDPVNEVAYLTTNGGIAYSLMTSPLTTQVGKDSVGVHVVTRVTSDLDTEIVVWAEFGGSTVGRVIEVVELVAGVPKTIDLNFHVGSSVGTSGMGSIYIGWHPPAAYPTVPVKLKIEPLLISDLGDVGGYFDGSTPDADNNYYSWAGVVDNSVSRLNTWN